MRAALETPRGMEVGRLRVAGDQDAARRARLALERTAPEVPGLAPGAILVVRRLADPLPGRFAPDPRRPGAGSAWTEALAAALAAAARGAVRPWDGPVPAACPAVVFRDRAEMLACLARDAAAGTLAVWWWASLGPDPRAAARTLWVREPFDVPHALALLAGRGLAACAARLLGPAACAHLAPRVARAHAIHPDHLAPPPAVPADGGLGAPLPDAVPEAADPSLPPESARLVHVSLLVARHPAAARRPLSSPVPGTPPASAGPDSAPGTSPPTPRATAARRPTGPPAPQPAPSAAGAAPLAREEAGRGPSPRPVTHPAPPPGEGVTPLGPRAQTAVRQMGAGAPAVTPAPRGGDRESALPAAERPSGIDTGWAGVLFLVNALLRLGLYADLGCGPVRNGDRAGGAGLWDLVEIVGRDLAGPEAEGDPVWPLLAGLAGRREGSPPPVIAGPPGRRERLSRAVGAWVTRRLRLTDPAARVRTLMARPGRVTVTAGRVDVELCLDDHPFCIRAAGLDRDPGPVPAAGRWVAFTFK